MFVNLKKKKGLTLVEMVISALILGMTLGAMLGTFIIARIGATKAKHRIEVMNLLRGKIEELKDTDYDDIVDEGTEPVSIDIGPDGVRDTDDDLVGEQSVSVEDKTGYKEVTVTISWDDLSWGGGSTAVSEELVTLISR